HRTKSVPRFTAHHPFVSAAASKRLARVELAFAFLSDARAAHRAIARARARALRLQTLELREESLRHVGTRVGDALLETSADGRRALIEMRDFARRTELEAAHRLRARAHARAVHIHRRAVVFVRVLRRKVERAEHAHLVVDRARPLHDRAGAIVLVVALKAD